MAQVVSIAIENLIPTEKNRLQQKKERQEQLKQQTEETWDSKKNPMVSAYKIAKGRIIRKRAMDTIGPDATAVKIKKLAKQLVGVEPSDVEIKEVEDELANMHTEDDLSKVNTNSLVVQSHISNSAHAQMYHVIKLPVLDESSVEYLHYAIYKHLWVHGYFVTGGVKFGCRFLAYPGDPELFHASHMVVCLSRGESCSALSMTGWCRIASQVKKNVMLCSIDDSGEVTSNCVNWHKVE